MSRCHFDANLYSEPFAIMNLIWDFQRAKNQNGFAWHYSLCAPRLRRLVATRNSLRSRVAEFVGVDVDDIHVEKPPVQMEHAKITLLRVIQVWVFSDTMIESIQAASATEGAVTLTFTGDTVTASHLEQVLDPERHPFAFVSNRTINQNGSFSPVSDDDFSMNAFLSDFESRLVSFGVEKSIDLLWYTTEEAFHLIAPKRVVESEGFETFCNTRLAQFKETHLTAQRTEQRRGIKERPCGLWDIQLRRVPQENEEGDNEIHLTKWMCMKKNVSKSVSQYLSRHVLDLEGVTSSLCCTFTRYKKKGRRTPSFSMISRGKCFAVSSTDLCDLFATPNVKSKTQESESVKQKIVFSPTLNTPIPYAKQATKFTTGDHSPRSSWNRPLLNDIPEGARLLSVLASGRRKEHSILLSSDEEANPDLDNQRKKDDDSYLQVSMNRDETKISQRWRQFSSDRSVYVAENTVPAAAMSMLGPVEVFACCANTLEVRGGGLRVEGLTLLPPGRLFALLSFLTFGLQPFSTGQIFSDDSDDEYGSGSSTSLLSQSLKWLNTWEELVAGIGGDSVPTISPDIDRSQRILAAKAFHSSCTQLGESLVCYPDKVRELCKIFDMVDGEKVSPWEDLDANPFIEKSLRRRKSKKEERPVHPKVNGSSRSTNIPAKKPERTKARARSKRSQTKEAPVKTPTTALVETPATAPVNAPTSKTPDKTPTNKQHPSKDSLRETAVLDKFPQGVVNAAAKLFAITLKPGESVDMSDLPSTNILCVVVKHYCDFLLEKNLAPDDAQVVALERDVSLSDRHWIVRSVKDRGGKEWYLAEFIGTVMPLLSVKKRSKNVPGWIFQGRSRPTTAQRAMECVPSHVAKIPRYTAKVSFSECDSGKAVFFDSVERALRMEAAFWLERQFGEASRHWYQQTLEEMIAKATTLEAVVLRQD